MPHAVLAVAVCLAAGVGALHGQELNRPITRAETLGRLAAGEPPSYVAHLVEVRGIAFSVTADYLDMIRLAGGAGILLERLTTTTEVNSSSASYADDPPFADLARCAQSEQIGANAEAESECDAAAKADPQSPWPPLAMSRCLLRRMKPDDAAAQANRAAQLSPEIVAEHLNLNAFLSSSNDPQLASTHLRIAQSLLRGNKKEEGWAELSEAIRLEPDNPMNHATLGFAYGNDKIDAARSEFQEVVDLEPFDANAHEILARFLEAHNGMAAAVAEMLEAVKLDPRDAGAHLDLIELYKTSKDTDNQIREFQRFLVVDPDAHDDRLDLAELLLGKHALDESAAECQELIRRVSADQTPDDQDERNRWLGWAHNTLGNVLVAQERIEEGEAEYQLARQALPEEEVPVSNLANISLRQGRLQEAIDQFGVAQGLNPSDIYVTVGLGIAFGRLGKLDSAEDEFEVALATDPDNEGARAGLAHVFESNGQLAQAIAEYETVLASHPDSALSHNNLADIYATSPDPRYRNPEAALEHAQRAVELSKTHSTRVEQAIFLGTLAEALRLNGKSDEIVPTLRQAIAVDPTSASAHRNLASVLESSGDHAGAISEYEQELHVQPDSASAQNDLAWLFATCPDMRYRNPMAALEHASRAVELSNTDSSSTERAAFLDTLAEALLVNERYQEALNAEERAADADPGNIAINKRVDRFKEAVRLSAIP